MFYNLWICEFQSELHLMTTNSDIEYILITTLTVLFFVLPVVLSLNRLKHKMTFSLTKIIRLFNYSLIPQIGLGLLLYLTFLVFGGNIFGNLTKTNWFELISIATLWFYNRSVLLHSLSSRSEFNSWTDKFDKKK